MRKEVGYFLTTKGRIKQSLSGYYDVLVEDKEYRTRARGNFRKKKMTPVVGDWVDFKIDDNGDGYILKIYPRKNQLVRPPIANIDTAIVVSACVEPDFSPNLLDRQLVMLESNNVRPVLFFSKADLLNQEQREKFESYFNYYSKYYSCYISFENENRQNVLNNLMSDLTNEIVVVMGQTGAGKSTLLNDLKPDLSLETGKISKALSRGKHTTRKVTLLDINGVMIADTPGFSSFELLNITKETLPLMYPDFVKYQDNCKFRGCLHLKEPKCAVKDAVNKGEILENRYINYVQFQDMLANKKVRYK